MLNNNLHIIDVSPFVHAGNVNKYAVLTSIEGDAARCYTLTTPVGGASLIMNTLYSIPTTDDVVFCCDRNPTIKKDMLPTYKYNRHHNREIEVDKAATEYILQECGCTVLARAGYEADDIIYTIVQQQRNNYGHIYVYTGDSDLYLLVDDKVSIRPSSSRAKEVTMENFGIIADKMNGVYNNLSFAKVLDGDKSDCIPPLPPAERDFVANQFLGNDYTRYGDKKYVFDLARELTPDQMHQFELVYPLDVEDVPVNFNKPDRQMLANFGKAIHNKYFGAYRVSEDFDIDYHIKIMQSRGYYVEKED